MRQILVMAALLASAPLSAEAAPRLLPIHDVVVEYRSSGMMPGPAGEASNTVIVRFAGNQDRLRIDGPNSGIYALLDVDQARLIMVMPAQRLYSEQPADPNMMAVFQPERASFRPMGVETVSGLPCTSYDVALNDRTGEVCLTSDGVLLRASLVAPDQRPALEALSVTYARQPEALFGIPPDYRRLDVPMGAFSMAPGMLGRAPWGR